MTGAKCSPYGIHFGFDTYALAHGTGTALTKSGGDSWYFITSDYAFGHALERDTMAAVRAAGGKVLGAVRAPLNNADFSSFLIQARASGAKVIGFALAGTDLQNCIKQAAGFGLTRGGARIATLLVQVTDLVALGHKTCEGMVLTDSFYWDQSEATRAWSRRYMAKMTTPPGLQHAAVYTGVTHWLKAVQAAGGTDADAVAAQMKAMPVNDMYNENVRIREDGRTLHVMHLWEVKREAEAKYKYDFCKLLTDIPPDQAWRPLSEGGCPLVKRLREPARTRRVSHRRGPGDRAGGGRMDGMDLRRRLGWSAAEAKVMARAALLRRRQPGLAAVTAADCLALGRRPERRLEPLRRRQGNGP
ncbi:ABC transporter substrate-binding protein [Dankookia sp. P2]|uniref:ABC transporter substrate-binding protein n=1 Tax=Dankookia sp. P2 TaxID=3423955 RepID=UPI003D67DF53